MDFRWRDMVMYYINLDRRMDRRLLMNKELKRVGLDSAIRLRGMLPNEYKGDLNKVMVMLKRTPGAIGCHFSQRLAMQNALEQGKSVLVMEDDLRFCSDIQARLDHIERFVNTHEWDVFWLGGTVHVNPAYWHTGKNPDLPTGKLGRDAELTDDPRIIRTYGAFSTFAYIVNVHSIKKILALLDKYVHESMGIDWLFIRLQPELKTYAFVPGCVKQYDNRSDIGKGITYFSGFAKLGPHWFQNNMNDFNPDTYNWGEAKVKK